MGAKCKSVIFKDLESGIVHLLLISITEQIIWLETVRSQYGEPTEDQPMFWSTFIFRSSKRLKAIKENGSWDFTEIDLTRLVKTPRGILKGL